MHTSLKNQAMMSHCRGVLESMFEWVLPPMLRVAIRMVRAPLPMQDLNLVASCMRLLDALLVTDFRDNPQAIAEMNDNVQMVRAAAHRALQEVFTSTDLSLLIKLGRFSDRLAGCGALLRSILS